jgi:hypothetical protein
VTQIGEHQIRTFKTREEVETLREFWNACCPSRDADLDFYLFIIDLYPEAVRPHVIVLYSDDGPRALLAGRLDRSTIPLRAGYFTLPVPSMRILQFVHGGWLGDISEPNAERLIGSIIDTLAAGEADAAFFHCPNLSSPLVRWATRLPHRWCSDYLIQPQIHRVRDFSGATDAFLASLSKKERYQQRQRVRRMEQDFGERAIEVLTQPEEVSRLVRDAEAVAKTSYQRGLGVGFSDTPIIRARLEFEARKGWLRGYILYLDKRPSAFWIGSLRNGTFLSDYIAFDPAYTQYSPGMYLIVKVMEELHGDPRVLPTGVERIDFGIGDAFYKEKLSNNQWPESPVYIFAPTMKGAGLNAMRSGTGLLNRSAKALMGGSPLLGRIKRTWRTRVTERE